MTYARPPRPDEPRWEPSAEEYEWAKRIEGIRARLRWANTQSSSGETGWRRLYADDIEYLLGLLPIQALTVKLPPEGGFPPVV